MDLSLANAEIQAILKERHDVSDGQPEKPDLKYILWSI
jgi:hypothetical protein